MAEDYFIHEDVYQAFVHHFRNRPAFPNLLHLVCEEDAKIHSYRSLFLSPRLMHLEFHPPHCDDENKELITSVNAACPSLRKLRILADYTVDGSRGLFDPICQLVHGLWNLEYIECGFPLSPAAIVHLSSLPTLTHMSLSDHPRSIVRSLAGTSSPFSHLVTLTIPAWDSQSVIELLNVLDLMHLKHLEIEFTPFQRLEVPFGGYESAFINYQPTWPNSTDLAQLIAAVGAACSPLKLQSLAIIPQEAEWFTLSLASPNIIRPLFSLKSLTSLTIDEICNYDFDDAFCGEVAGAWPLLQKFHARQTNKPKVTLNGLTAILSGCAQLTNLCISISVSPFDVQSFYQRHGIYNQPILNLGTDDNVERADLVNVFDILCPNFGFFYLSPHLVHLDKWR